MKEMQARIESARNGAKREERSRAIRAIVGHFLRNQRLEKLHRMSEKSEEEAAMMAGTDHSKSLSDLPDHIVELIRDRAINDKSVEVRSTAAFNLPLDEELSTLVHVIVEGKVNDVSGDIADRLDDEKYVDELEIIALSAQTPEGSWKKALNLLRKFGETDRLHNIGVRAHNHDTREEALSYLS